MQAGMHQRKRWDLVNTKMINNSKGMLHQWQIQTFS